MIYDTKELYDSDNLTGTLVFGTCKKYIKFYSSFVFRSGVDQGTNTPTTLQASFCTATSFGVDPLYAPDMSTALPEIYRITPNPPVETTDTDVLTNWSCLGWGSHTITIEYWNSKSNRNVYGEIDTPAVGGLPSSYISKPVTYTGDAPDNITSDDIYDMTRFCYQIYSDDIYDGWRFSLEYYDNFGTGTVDEWFDSRKILHHFDNSNGEVPEVLLYFKSIHHTSPYPPAWWYADEQFVIEQAYLFVNGTDYYSDAIAAMTALCQPEIEYQTGLGAVLTDHDLLAWMFMV